MAKRRLRAAVTAAVLTTLGVSSAHAIVTSTSTLGSIDISTVIGANAFYSNGYTGSGAVIANIEAGVVSINPQSLNGGQITQYFADPSLSNQAGWRKATNTWTDRHATWVGHTLVGRGSSDKQQGIAYGAKLWSGAIATSWASMGTGNWSGNFSISGASFTTPYYEAMVGGLINGAGTADVINSSYGGASGQDGDIYYSQTIDALDYTSGQSASFAAKLICIAAGNSGTATNTVGFPASGFNAMVVGSTGNSTNGYSAVSSFSSRSPTDVFDPSLNSGAGGTVSGARDRIDIVAPGEDLTLAYYGGATGGNVFGGPTTSSTTTYTLGDAGTSFATPIVAASAALVVNAGRSLFPGDAKAIDARVIKAVLMNSATQLAGYNNGQTVINGVTTTSTSLDPNQGAGELNLTAAYPQYTAGTTDVPGSGGGTVQTLGWDYGALAAGAHNDYTLNTALKGGSTFTITVDWFAHTTINVAAESTDYDAFDNIDLQVYENINGVLTLIATSDSKYNSVEHLSFAVPDTATYVFRVLDVGYNWNGIDGSAADTSTDYGVTWDGVSAVPEPSMACVFFVGVGFVLGRRRRAGSRSRYARSMRDGD